MEKLNKLETQTADCDLEEESAETLAAIDEGVKDVLDGRTVSGSEVRKHLPQWTTGSGTRKER
jgi:predicted transcriptional regulator